MSEAKTNGHPSRSIPDISIVGFGITSIDHMTLAAERRLRQSKQVFYVDHGLGVRDFLEARCASVTDLADLYAEGEVRQGTYQKMAAAVLDAALDNAPVTFGLYGHPLVFATPPFLIARAAEDLGLSVEVLAGVSSLDQILVDLMFDPCDHGLQVVEATDLVLNRRTLLNDSMVLLLQVGAFGSRCFSDHRNRPERLQRLQSYLLAFYPSHHVIHAVFSSSSPLVRSTVHSFRVDELTRHAPTLHTGYTLVLPPAVKSQSHDWHLSRHLDDREFLEQMTY